MLKKVFFTFMLATGLVANALAADPATEQVSTALMHAKFSAQSKDIAGVHLHLHHVLNCLVGKDGDGFDASAGNPCQGKGGGAINDEPQSGLKARLEEIASKARMGVADDDLSTARQTASTIQEKLQVMVSGDPVKL